MQTQRSPHLHFRFGILVSLALTAMFLAAPLPAEAGATCAGKPVTITAAGDVQGTPGTGVTLCSGRTSTSEATEATS